MNAMLTTAQVAQYLPYSSLVGDASVVLQRVHTDTRTLEQGDLFVALQGEHFDGNDLLHEAHAKGASAVLCHTQDDTRHYPVGLPRIEVADTRLALGQLAAAWRAQYSIPLIAVTGSNGKTTVTQMIASILDNAYPNGAFLATRGNLNNDIGVPLTLLRLNAQHRAAVVELGMNHPGEIALLAKMAQPTVALVNNAQREHLEFMDTVQAVAQENGSVIEFLDSQGVAVFARDDDYAALWQGLAGSRRVFQFALNVKEETSANVLACVSAIWSHGAWQVHACGMQVVLRYRLAIAGWHNVKNSLAAAACALAAGVPADAVVRGLDAFTPVQGRSRVLALNWQGRECTLVDDTYNANPDSVQAAIDVLAELPGPRLLVLGDMGEVGHQGPSLHAEVGRYAHSKGIEKLWTVGEMTRNTAQTFPGALHFASVQEIDAALCTQASACSSILVKGSRFMRMERVVQMLVAHAQSTAQSTHAVEVGRN